LWNGWRQAKIYGNQPADEFLIGRAVVKIALGVVIFWLLGAGWRVLDRDTWLLLLDLQWPVRAIAIWCFITGAAKFALLAGGEKTSAAIAAGPR
jgi:hypothetical protein